MVEGDVEVEKFEFQSSGNPCKLYVSIAPVLAPERSQDTT
jgi:hypothetical protein